jgi:hypothetical protein
MKSKQQQREVSSGWGILYVNDSTGYGCLGLIQKSCYDARMIAKLTDDLAKALEQAGDQPLRVENPRNRKRYLIVPEEHFRNPADQIPSSPGGEWSEAKNRRRFVLIDKKIAKTLTQEEEVELKRLQDEVGDYLNRVAPLPLAETRALHEELRRALTNDH